MADLFGKNAKSDPNVQYSSYLISNCAVLDIFYDRFTLKLVLFVTNSRHMQNTSFIGPDFLMLSLPPKIDSQNSFALLLEM